MSLQQTIKESLKDAMKSGDSVRVTVIRGLSSAFTNELVATKRTPQDTLTDDEVLTVITREAKRRKDSISQFNDAGRADLATDEQAELTILEEYLPTLMTTDEIRAYIVPKIAEMGDMDASKSGMITGVFMKELKGKAAGDDVKMVIDEILKA